MASETRPNEADVRKTRFLTEFLTRAGRWWPVAIIVVFLIWMKLRPQQTPVGYAVARRAALDLTIAASGKVDGDSSDLSFTSTGKIIALSVQEGESIAEQQLLARLNLASSGSDETIQAPYDGSVVDVYRKLGEVVNPGTPVLRVVRRGGLYITAYLDSEDAAWVKPGDRFVARAGGYLARGWNLRVKSVGKEAVPREDVIGSARQVRAQLSVIDSGFALPLGTAVDIDGTVQITKEALQIPASAVVREEARTFVWRISNDHLQQTNVTLGPNNFRDVVITSGLAAGDNVVVDGKTGLQNGQAVDAKPWQEQS